MLKACIAKVPRLLGCEAAYYFPKGLDVCHAPKEGGEGSNESTGGEFDRKEVGAVDHGSQEEAGANKGAGTLAIHIRSGDIFYDDVLANYGQVIQQPDTLLIPSFVSCKSRFSVDTSTNPFLTATNEFPWYPVGLSLYPTVSRGVS